jgi:hypothetical protein
MWWADDVSWMVVVEGSNVAAFVRDNGVDAEL